MPEGRQHASIQRRCDRPLHRRVPPRATVRRCPQCDFASRPYLVAGVSLSRSHAAPLRIRCDPCAQLQSFLRHARAYFPPRDRSQRGVNGSCGPGRLDDLSLPSVEDTNLSNFAETSVAPCGGTVLAGRKNQRGKMPLGCVRQRRTWSLVAWRAVASRAGGLALGRSGEHERRGTCRRRIDT